MQKWKFLLLGITGDLAKRKILPGLAQFAERNSDSVTIDLIGYSRSAPDNLEIIDILNKFTASAKHNIADISYIQGEYSDSSFFEHLIQTLGKDERLVVYIATPPVVFLQLLETFCPFNAYNLDIIIEKPFGQDLVEAKRILQKVNDCKLHNNIHYCDHYLFKSAAYVNHHVLNKLQFVKGKQLKKVSVVALEEIDTKGREGYYDTNGALKDMLPAHLYSLLNLALTTFTHLDVKDLNDFTPERVTLGQYKSYLDDLGKQDSTTETYFKVMCTDSVEMILESGKKLGQKNNEIIFEYIDGSTLRWNIDPDKTLEYVADGQFLHFDLNGEGTLDHTNMFEDLLNGISKKFFVAGNILPGWELYESVKDLIKKQNITPVRYIDNTWPIEQIN
jgi:glucose-6-phosphate 1-dehydrogenase